MTRRPKFSVVTISFNQARFLERALDSVLSQQGVDVEYIVVDPGSTDGSRDIIERYRPHLAHVILEPDAGPADGLNKGLALATGEFFYYLNSDDRVLPNAFLEAAQAFERRPQVDVIYGNGVITDEHDRIVRRVYSDRRPTPLTYALGVSVFVQQSTFLRTQAVREVGGFNVQNRGSWDGELMLDLMRAGKTLRREWRFWSEFRIHGDSITGSDRYRSIIRANQDRISGRYGKLVSLFPLIRSAAYLWSRALDLRQLGDRLLRPAWSAVGVTTPRLQVAEEVSRTPAFDVVAEPRHDPRD